MTDDSFIFSVTVLAVGPLFRVAALAEITQHHIQQTAENQPGQLWGYVVVPEDVHFILQVTHERDYHVWVDAFKTASEKALVDAVLHQYPALVDHVTRFNPAWGGAIYRVWQEGYHSQPLHSVYAVSNRLADLLRKPVDLGLVEHVEDWPYSSYEKQA